MGAAGRNAREKSKSRFAMIRTLNLQGLLRREKAGEAFGQSANGFHIQGVGSTEGIKDIGFRLPGPGIPDIMGQLDAGGGRSVLVLSGNRSNVQVYSNSMYYHSCPA
jgi:hypothetical protein